MRLHNYTKDGNMRWRPWTDTC